MDHRIPAAQDQAVLTALAQRFGFDPKQVTDLTAEGDGSSSTVEITWTEHRTMPWAEYAELFNTAGRP